MGAAAKEEHCNLPIVHLRSLAVAMLDGAHREWASLHLEIVSLEAVVAVIALDLSGHLFLVDIQLGLYIL